MKYLYEKQHYIDRYDLQTIEECLDYYKAIKKEFDKERGSEKFKKYTDRSFARETQKVLNILLFTIKGTRYKNKTHTIQEWMDRDRKEQEKYDHATPPTRILCKECNSPTKVTDKDLMHSHEENSQVLFMFRCIKCNKGQAFYEDGTEWIYVPPKCPECNAPLNHDSKDVDDVLTTIYSCTKCSYKKEDLYDFKKSRLEREQEEAKNKRLLEQYREEFCLSDEKGQEYIETFEAMEVGDEVYKEEMQKYDDSAYEVVSELKKLNIVELEKLLSETLEKANYTKLAFDKPEMGQQVVIPFTVQDTDPSRNENVSVNDLKKLVKDTLEETNWRLMSEGIHNRLGILFGNLKGYEGEEALLELVGKKKEQPLPQIDSEKRQKYAHNNLVQMARIKAEVDGAEKIRKKRLLKEPNGFAIPAGETYSCHICHTSINSTNGWYDKYGFKCEDCQRAVNEGILPPEVFEEENCWYSDWHIESEWHIPKPTIKRLVKEGKLKPRIVKSSSGRDHAYVFMALENNDLLEEYMQKHRMLLLWGIPASGKSAFGRYLENKHNYTYISLETDEWKDKKLQTLWNHIFEAKRQYDAVEKFVCYLHENYERVVLDWKFSMDQIEVAGLLKRQWVEIIWLTCSTLIARKRFLERNKNSATYFDNIMQSIKENDKKIVERLNPKIIDALKEDKQNKTMEEVYLEYSLLINN